MVGIAQKTGCPSGTTASAGTRKLLTILVEFPSLIEEFG